MKNKNVFLLILSMLLLAACGGTSPNETAENTSSEQNIAGDIQANQLLFGTVMLEGSVDEITAEQAAELLPLWQLLETMSASNTTAQEEVQAVLKQIEVKMTAGQLAFIVDQEFNPQDMFALAEEMGIEMTFAGRGEGGEDGFTPPDGVVGGVPGSGAGRAGGGLAGGTPAPELQVTQEARRAERGGGVNTVFYQIVIELLQEKIN